MRFISPHDCSLPRSQFLESSLHANPTAGRFRSSRCGIASVNMSESSLEQEERLARQRLYNALELGLTKLQHDPASITTGDAQALADVVPEGDEQIVTLAVALQELAIQNASNKEVILSDEGHTPTNRLSQLAEDLYAAVIANPEDVTAKTLQTTKSILDSKSHATPVPPSPR